MELKNLLAIIVLLLIIGSCNQSPQDNQETSLEILKPKTDSILVGNTSFEYRIDEGSGEIPCIVVGMAQMYPDESLSDDLKSKFKFIHVDYRGLFQQNDLIDVSKITLDSLLADIELLRKELKLGKTAILGHSIHGLVALEYGRKYSKNVSHIIVVGSPAAMDSTSNRLISEYWDSNASEQRKQILIDRQTAMKDSLNKVTPSERFILSYVTNAPIYFYNSNYDCTWIWRDIKPLNMDLVYHLIGNIFKDYTLDWSQNNIETPVFVALGKYDFAAPPTLWEETSRNTLSNLTIEQFEKSGHWPFVEEKELFYIKLKSWMDSLDTK